MAELQLKNIHWVIWVESTSCENEDKKILIDNFQIILGAHFRAVTSFKQAMLILQDSPKFKHIIICSYQLVNQFKSQVIGKHQNIQQKCIVLCRNNKQKHAILQNNDYKDIVYEPIRQIYHICGLLETINKKSINYPNVNISKQIHRILQLHLQPRFDGVELILIINQAKIITIKGIQVLKLAPDLIQQFLNDQVQQNGQKRFCIILTDKTLDYFGWMGNYQNVLGVYYYTEGNSEDDFFENQGLMNCQAVYDSNGLSEALVQSELFKY